MATSLLPQQSVLETLVSTGAVLTCEHPTSQPHYMLSSGLHTCTYFNCRKLVETPHLLLQVADQLAERYRALPFTCRSTTATCIAGPAVGGTMLAHELANRLCNGCFVSPRKDPQRPGRYLPFTDQERARVAGHYVLMCDDVITTGGSFMEVAAMVRNAGGTVLRDVLAIVNRSGNGVIGSHPITALLHREADAWNPKDCPLCQKGSEAIRPRD